MTDSFEEMVEKATPTRVGTHPDTVRRVLTAAGVPELLARLRAAEAVCEAADAWRLVEDES